MLLTLPWLLTVTSLTLLSMLVLLLYRRRIHCFHRAKPGASRGRIFPNFALARDDRFLRQDRGLARSRQFAETLFDLAVFQAMERYDYDASAWAHHARRGFQKGIDLFHFAI